MILPDVNDFYEEFIIIRFGYDARRRLLITDAALNQN